MLGFLGDYKENFLQSHYLGVLYRKILNKILTCGNVWKVSLYYLHYIIILQTT